MRFFRSCLTIVAISTCLANIAGAEEETPPQPPVKPQRFMAHAYYFREVTDQPWNIKIIGEIPSMAGAYIIIHDVRGKILYKGTIDYGEYPEKKPFLIHFPADGVTGDYKFILLGQQQDFTNMDLPVSDLPLEVYGGKWFSFMAITQPTAFRVRSGTKVLGMRSYRGHSKVYDDKMQVVADSKAGLNLMKPTEDNKGFYNALDNPLEFEIDSKRHYWLSVGGYFEPREDIFFAFDLARLFEPDPRLENWKWWRLVNKQSKENTTPEATAAGD